MGKILIKEEVGIKIKTWVIKLLIGLAAVTVIITYALVVSNIMPPVFLFPASGLIAIAIAAFIILRESYEIISYGTKGVKIRDNSFFGSLTWFDIPIEEIKGVSVIEIENRYLPQRKPKTTFRSGRDKFSDVVFWGIPSVPYNEILDQPNFVNNAILVENTNGKKYALLSNDVYATFESIKGHYPIRPDMDEF